MLTIAIFTRKFNSKLEDLLNDLKDQTVSKLEDLLNDLKDQTVSAKIKVYNDHQESIDGVENIYTKNQNISEKRNRAIQESDTKYLFLLDDDNRIFDPNFIQNLMENYKKVQKFHRKSVISPVIYRRDTDIIQSAGISFSYLFGNVKANKILDGDFWKTRGIGGNSLFAETDFFKFAEFDSEIGYVYEDIDYIYSLARTGVYTFLVNQKINHMERDKTRAEHSFVGDKKSLDRKIKNRKIFVQKHANGLEKILYWSLGHWLGLIYWNLLRIFSR